MVALAGSWWPKQTLMFSGDADSKKITKTGMGLSASQGYENSLAFAIRVTAPGRFFTLRGNW